MPDRTFHSLATTWRLITNDSPTDVKELIPELFYLPELFYNNEGLKLLWHFSPIFLKILRTVMRLVFYLK